MQICPQKIEQISNFTRMIKRKNIFFIAQFSYVFKNSQSKSYLISLCQFHPKRKKKLNFSWFIALKNFSQKMLFLNPQNFRFTILTSQFFYYFIFSLFSFFVPFLIFFYFTSYNSKTLTLKTLKPHWTCYFSLFVSLYKLHRCFNVSIVAACWCWTAWSLCAVWWSW